MEPVHPKVFVSHASEDKERFVLEFARRLREQGIDAWVDKWEMLPGDSLVDKIFEEGIKNAQAVIVVISKFSIQKRWVREELNAGLVRRISGQSKLIPVVIDECAVPEALRSTVWESIRDLTRYETELERIVAAIYGHTEKPRLGSPPPYTQAIVTHLSGLTAEDSLVFKAACDMALERGQETVDMGELGTALQKQGMSSAQIVEALEMLRQHYFIDGQTTAYGTMLYFTITPYGFEQYATAYLPDFEQLLNDTLVAIINHKLRDDSAVASHLGRPTIFVGYLLDVLSNKGYITIAKPMVGIIITEITTQGRRVARQM